MITGFYAGLLGLWLVFLILSVVRLRRKYRVGLGDGGQRELTQAIRVHGNFCETVPFILILMGLVEHAQMLPAAALHGFGGALVVSRVLHWRGIMASPGATVGRTAGTAAICLMLAAGGGLLIFNFIAGS